MHCYSPICYSIPRPNCYPLYFLSSLLLSNGGREMCDVTQMKENDFLPTTVGSKSTITARGTCFPDSVSWKKVPKDSSSAPSDLSLGIWPSGWIPCSRQYSSQHALPIWTPAWPTWIEIHSRWKLKVNSAIHLLNLKIHFYLKHVFFVIFIRLYIFLHDLYNLDLKMQIAV